MNSATKQRESNIELLRLLAMMLVIVTHIDGNSLGYPMPEDYLINHSSVFLRLLFASLSAVCVDLFILISGWFGIYPNKRKFFSFIYQCLFFSLSMYVIACIVGKASFTPYQLFRNCILIDYWFIPAYIGLYVLAPVMNSFVEQSNKKQFTCIVVGLFILELLYGWKFETAGFNSGYSIIHFLLLYLIARYLRKYTFQLIKLPAGCDVLIFLLLSLLSTILGMLYLKNGRGEFEYYYLFEDHSSPITILAAIFLFLAFTKIRIGYNKVINYLASSAFAIYLFHQHPTAIPKFKTITNSLFYNNDLLSYSYKIVCFIIGVSLIAILIDQIRIYSWKLIQYIINGNKCHNTSLQ